MDINLKGCRIQKNVSLSQYTSFKVGGAAKIFIEPQNAEAAALAVRELRDKGMRFRVLGNGSNLLVKDGGVDEPVIHIGSDMAKLKCDGNRIFCGAGALLSAAARFAYKNLLTGMEFAQGIPGSIGGALRMNAGAYGGEMKDIAEEIEYINEDGVICTMPAKEAGFGYRKSIFQEKDFIITGSVMRLKKGDGEAIMAKMRELAEKRRQKQPLEYPSAGSTFKRPAGYFAAALIEEAGLKGLASGGAEVSTKHAGFIINKNNATASDILDLIETVKEKVWEKSSVELETEVEVW